MKERSIDFTNYFSMYTYISFSYNIYSKIIIFLKDYPAKMWNNYIIVKKKFNVINPRKTIV